MKSRVEASAWDRAWYVRYFDAAGEPLGSSRNTYGQIDLTGQVWPVISGFASPDRARTAMDSVYARLNTKYGIKLSTPGFDGYEVARRVRAEDKSIRLIALTGYGQPDDRRRALEAGFDAHLVKPVDFETLDEAIRAPRAEP